MRSLLPMMTPWPPSEVVKQCAGLGHVNETHTTQEKTNVERSTKEGGGATDEGTMGGKEESGEVT